MDLKPHFKISLFVLEYVPCNVQFFHEMPVGGGLVQVTVASRVDRRPKEEARLPNAEQLYSTSATHGICRSTCEWKFTSPDIIPALLKIPQDEVSTFIAVEHMIQPLIIF